jgi:hypothetical protein
VWAQKRYLSCHTASEDLVEFEAVSIILSSYAPDHDQDEQVLDASCDDGLCQWGQRSE